MRKLFLLLIFTCLILPALHAQYDLPFGFEKNYNIAVDDSMGNPLPNPWAGGMNACQFGEIDLDGDGIRDLVVFDRNGNRTLTWKNHGTPGEISNTFDPSLAEHLPHFDDWVIFADYNMDGLNDIFTYSKGFAGIRVFRNTGNPDEMFELVVYPYLKSFQGNGYVNVLVTYVDYPAIFDLDGDGDLDLLTFWGLGSFVEFHLNESMEKYGVPDSLIFRKTENCWGRFAESEESNTIYLDTCFDRNTMAPRASEASHHPGGSGGGAPASPPPSPEGIAMGRGVRGGAKDPKHTGSTFMIFDNNGDGLYDLLLGDVDYAAPVLLTNGGTPEEALMTSHTFIFPDYDTPIDLLSFPAMFYLDVNNDDTKDMIVSPFDPSLVKSRNVNNNWLYINNGETVNPDFELTTKAFMQDQMLDFGAGAVPVLFDHNGDGLQDIVVGNFGYFDSSYYGTGLNLYCDYRAQLALLENTGTAAQPAFRLVTRNYANLPDYFPEHEKPFAAVPAFGDLDGDGDKDMLVGNEAGTLFYFENTAQPGQPADFTLTNQEYQNIDAGSYSAPQLFDLDDDGLEDLVIGRRNGTITCYRNTGTASNPEYSFFTDSLGRVDVRNPNRSIFGYCIPHFFRDGTGEIHLFAGSEFGEIFYYDNIRGNLDGTFNLVMKNYLWIDEGLRSAVTTGNLNGDGYPDMIVGNYSGGLGYFEGTAAPPAGTGEEPSIDYGIHVFPNPAHDFLHIEYPREAGVKIIKISLMDFSGKEIRTIFDEPNQLKTDDLKEGIYLFRFWMETPDGLKSKTVKVVVG